MKKEWSEELRYDYPSLNKGSIVFDIGGFDGVWSDNIYSKYSCNIFVYEPVSEFCNNIKNKFIGIDKVRIYNYGLGAKDEIISIGINGSSTSIYNQTCNGEQVEIKDIVHSLNEFTKIDLVKINIEGAEYDLLEHIIRNGLQTKLINIQIQFHISNQFDYEERRRVLRAELSKTHHLTYDFEIGLHENWELNN